MNTDDDGLQETVEAMSMTKLTVIVHSVHSPGDFIVNVRLDGEPVLFNLIHRGIPEA